VNDQKVRSLIFQCLSEGQENVFLVIDAQTGKTRIIKGTREEILAVVREAELEVA
jgi:hypothetical protein